MSSRGKKVIFGFLFRNFSTILNIVISFFMMPFILRSLGDRMYGLWVLMGSFTGYLGYLDFGITSAISRFVARAIGRRDLKEVNEIVNTSLVIYLVISALTLFITIGLIIGAGWFVLDPSDLYIVRVLLLAIGLNLAIGFPTRAVGGVIGANLRYGISEGIVLTELILRNLLIFIFFKLGFGILALGFIVCGVSIFTYVLWVYFAFYVQKDMTINMRLFNKRKVKELFSYSIYTFISKLSEIFLYRLDPFVITAFVGLAPVAHYSIGVVLLGYFANLIHRSTELINPVFSQDEGKGDHEGISYKFFVTSRLAMYAAIFIGAMLFLYGKDFIFRWMGADYYDSYIVMAVLLFSVVLSWTQTPLRSLLYSISKHRFLAFTSIIEGVANLILSVIFVQRFGIVGVAMGTAIPMAFVRLFVHPPYACRVLNIEKRSYYVDLLGKGFVIGILGILPVYVVLKNYIYPDYLRLIILGSLQAVVYGIVIYFFGFKKDEKNYLLGFIRKRRHP